VADDGDCVECGYSNRNLGRDDYEILKQFRTKEEIAEDEKEKDDAGS